MITPNTTADEFNTGASCSLREAIQAANTDAAFGGCPAGSGADSIPLPAGTYTLSLPAAGTPDANTGGDLDIADGSTISIFPAGSGPVVLDGGGIDRVLHNVGAASNLILSRLTVRNGRTAGSGAGIQNNGVLTLTDSTVTGNTSTGSFGGGIASSGAAAITNVTVSGNRADTSDSGGIDQDSTALMTLNHVTVTGNSSRNGGGFHREEGPLTISNTIIAGNTDVNAADSSDTDCSAGFISVGNNLIGDPTGCDFVAGPGDKAAAPTRCSAPSPTTAGRPRPTRCCPAARPSTAREPGADPGRSARRSAEQPTSAPTSWRVCARRDRQPRRHGRQGQARGHARAPTASSASPARTRLWAWRAKDGLCGGNGKDTLKGGKGNDKLLGGRARTSSRATPARTGCWAGRCRPARRRRQEGQVQGGRGPRRGAQVLTLAPRASR